jgi:2-polyprenyl-6-methoxyphenol hydroxylase-like FAD-dependent oxidoreductase
MTGAMRDALELIRSLKEQYPKETEDRLISRFQKELEGDKTLKRALMRDVFKNLLQEFEAHLRPWSMVNPRFRCAVP